MKVTIFTPLVLKTADPIDVVIAKLNENIEKRRLFNSLRSNKIYQGEISVTGFKISRIISYQNSFLPIIYGNFSETEEGTEIKMILLPHWFVIIFFLVWCIGFFGPDVSSFLRGDIDSFSFFSLLFVVVFTGMFPYFLYTERKKTLEYLKQILKIKLLYP
jgi:hypothetical protein